ncbi:MAG: tetratricopeptide repeat protein [Nitrospirota bacterium]
MFYIKGSNDSAGTMQAADKLHTEGLMLFDEGKYNDAIEVWFREIIFDPMRPKPYNNIGIAYRKLGKPDIAILYHRKAISIDPSFGHSYYSLGLIHYDEQDYKTALDMFLKAIQNKYDSADVYYSIGQSYKNLKEYNKAFAAYETTVKRYFTYPGVHYQIGLIHLLQGNTDLARMEFKREQAFNNCYRLPVTIKILEMDAEQFPDNLDILFELGKLYAEMPNDEKAVNIFKKVIVHNPLYPEAHFWLGTIYFREGNLSEAEEEYVKELEVNHNNIAAQEALKKLREQLLRE